MKIDIDWSQLKTPLTGRFRPFDAIRSGRSPPPGNHISKSQKANDSTCLPILCQPDYEKQMKLVSGNTTKYLMVIIVIIPEFWLPINIITSYYQILQQDRCQFPQIPWPAQGVFSSSEVWPKLPGWRLPFDGRKGFGIIQSIETPNQSINPSINQSCVCLEIEDPMVYHVPIFLPQMCVYIYTYTFK